MLYYIKHCFSFPTHELSTIFLGIWDLLTEVVAALQHVEGSVRKQWLVDAVETSCVSTHPSTVHTRISFLVQRQPEIKR